MEQMKLKQLSDYTKARVIPNHYPRILVTVGTDAEIEQFWKHETFLVGKINLPN